MNSTFRNWSFNRLAVLVTALFCVTACPVQAQLSDLVPFTGIWAESAKGCDLLTSGELSKMPRSKSSNFGAIEISTRGVEWLYSAASCSFDGGRQSKQGPTIIIPATCEFKGESKPAETVVITLKSAGSAELLFSNGF